MNKSWMPLTAGILELISGAACLLGALILLIIALVGGGLFKLLDTDLDPLFPGIPIAILIIVALPILVLGILEIVGGISAVQARKWGWALTGAICACLTSSLMGIAAIIFTVLGKNDFH